MDLSKEHINELIRNYTRRLQKLRERQALQGISVDPSVPLEIENIEAELNVLNTRLSLGFAAQLGQTLALEALGRTVQAFNSDGEATALQHAYATGIAAILNIYPGEPEQTRLEACLHAYFTDQQVKTELFKFIQPHQSPDLQVLVSQWQALFSDQGLSHFKANDAIQAFRQGFETGASDAEEFRSRLTLKRLGQINQQQTQRLEEVGRAARQLSQDLMTDTFVRPALQSDSVNQESDPNLVLPIPRSFQPHLRHLAEKINEGRVALFIGAGVSREAGLPRGWELAEMFASEIDYSPQPGDTLGTIAEYYERELPGVLINRLVKWLYEGASPGPSHRLIPEFNWSAIYTTNYDNLLEQGYGQGNKPYDKVLYNPQLQDLSTEATPIIKLHGCLSRAYRRSSQAPIVIADKHYEIYGPNRQALIGKLGQFLREGNQLLFLGYSLKDPFWQELRRDVAAVLKDYAPTYYAVIPHFTPQWANYWLDRQVRLIPGTAYTFLQQLSTLV